MFIYRYFRVVNIQKKSSLTHLKTHNIFQYCSVRRGEENELRRMATHLPLQLDNAKYYDPHTKANVLLQSHFERRPLVGDLARDQDAVLLDAPRLIQVANR